MRFSLKSERADRDRFRRVLRQLEIHLDYTGSLSGLSVPRLPEFRSIDEIKAFTGLIDSTQSHPWREWFLSQDERPAFTFAHSLFLFRKVLPGGSKSMAEKKFLEKMTTPQDPVDPKFLEFCRGEIRRLFPKKWDRHYRKKCHTLCLSTSSSIERSRSDFGPRGLDSSLSRLSFQRAIGEEPFPEGEHKAQVCPVPSDGKWRVVTINSAVCEGLKTYHHLLYDHLSKFSWLCRGKPNVKKFNRSNGEIFTSGDYESATDAIPLSLYQFLLREVGERSEYVPESVKDFAMKDSKKSFYSKSGTFLGDQARGQLMGSYLSFPFLCLLNYLCFKYSIRRDVPVLINGDDIVFRSTRQESEIWANNVQRCGLVLSKGKTLVHPRVFTLNSLLFRGGKNRGKAMGFFRPKAYFNCPRTGTAAAGQFNSCVVGFSGHEVKRRIQSNFLKEYKNFLFKRQLSLEVLGFKVSDVVMRMAGFLHHARFYKGDKMPAVAGTLIPGGFERLPLLPGRRARRNARASEKLFFREMVELSWLPGQKRPKVEEAFGSLHMPPKPKVGLQRACQKLLRNLTCSSIPRREEPSRKERRTYWGRASVLRDLRPIQWVRGEVMNPPESENQEDEVVFTGRRR